MFQKHFPLFLYILNQWAIRLKMHYAQNTSSQLWALEPILTGYKFL
jgi:hypothetical protein